MATKEDLGVWIVDALNAFHGSAPHIRVAAHVWSNHESDLKASGDLLYSWQYDLRWVAHELRLRKVLEPADRRDNGVWKLRQGFSA